MPCGSLRIPAARGLRRAVRYCCRLRPRLSVDVGRRWASRRAGGHGTPWPRCPVLRTPPSLAVVGPQWAGRRKFGGRGTSGSRTWRWLSAVAAILPCALRRPCRSSRTSPPHGPRPAARHRHLRPETPRPASTRRRRRRRRAQTPLTWTWPGRHRTPVPDHGRTRAAGASGPGAPAHRMPRPRVARTPGASDLEASGLPVPPPQRLRHPRRPHPAALEGPAPHPAAPEGPVPHPTAPPRCPTQRHPPPRAPPNGTRTPGVHPLMALPNPVHIL